LVASSSLEGRRGGEPLVDRLRALAQRLPERPTFEHGVWLLAAASPISISLANAAFVAAAALFARDWAAGRRRPERTPLDGAILAWVVADALSALTSVDPLRSVAVARNSALWGMYYLIAWGAKPERQLGSLVDVWLASGLVGALQAVVQATIGFDVRGRRIGRPRGFFSGHLPFAHVTAVLAMVAVARFWGARGARRLLWIPALALFGAALAASTARGPWLAFLVGVLVLAALRRSRSVLIAAMVMALAHGAVTALGPEGFRAHYASYLTLDPDTVGRASEQKVYSNLWRLAMWRESLARFAARPISGTGVETTGELSQDFTTPFEQFAVAHLHSNYFEVLMTRGFLGVAALFYLLAGGLRVFVDADGRADPSPGACAPPALAEELGGARCCSPVRSAPPGRESGIGTGHQKAAIFAGIAALVAHAVHGVTHFTLGSAPMQIVSYVALGFAAAAVPSGSVTMTLPSARAVAWGATTVATAFALSPLARGFPGWVIAAGCVASGHALVMLVRRRLGLAERALVLGFAFAVVASCVAPSAALSVDVAAAAALPFATLYGAVAVYGVVAARQGRW
jgi:O-antigen ligase